MFSCVHTESRSSIKLTPVDMGKRFVMCRWFENKIEEDPDFLDEFWFSDEAHFWFCGHINSKIIVCSGAQKSQTKRFRRPWLGDYLKIWHNSTVLVWKGRRRGAVTLTKEHFIDVLNKFLGRRTWNTSWCELRCAMVPKRWDNSTYSQHRDGVARPSIS